jgi:hypothetical protein
MIRKATLLAVVLLIFFQACKEKPETLPPEILSKEELVPLLSDLMIAQASLIIFEYTDTVSYTLMDYQKVILEKKNISPLRFENSMKYYAEKPETLKEIYDEVITELSKRQSELEKVKAEEQGGDSLNSVKTEDSGSNR